MVAVASCPLEKGTICNVDGQESTFIEDIGQGHKFTLKDINKKDQPIIKYGYPIGIAKDYKEVAITLRESINANINNWSAMLYDGKDYYFSKRYNMQIVDCVGGGDSFGAGLITASLEGYDAKSTIEFSVTASCLKHSIEGDFNMVSMDEVLKLASGDGSGRIQR